MIKNLIPPPRYKHCRLSNYNTNDNFPSQAAAQALLEETLLNLKKPSFFRSKKATGLYLDGSFGVGKTHLLAASYHIANVKKAYLSFTDLMSLMSYYSMKSVLEAFRDIQLICIDEFELDDPANTMKASNFIREMMNEGNSIISTSNTVPNELGKGRFAFKNFENEIGFIAEKFKRVAIDGLDYRANADENYFELNHNSATLLNAKKIEFAELKSILEKMPMLKYADFIKSEQCFQILNLEAFKIQDHALRFTHFVDKLYDQNKKLHLQFVNPLETTLFVDEFLHGSYQKKYKRCLSRLHEMSAKIPN